MIGVVMMTKITVAAIMITIMVNKKYASACGWAILVCCIDSLYVVVL